MIICQFNKSRDEASKFYYNFIKYKDQESDGISKHSCSFKSVNERTIIKYLSLYLELIYE